MMLETLVEKLPGVGAKVAEKLRRLKIKTVRDLVFHFPHRWEDFSNTKNIKDLIADEKATVIGRILAIKTVRTWKKRMMVTESIVEDKAGAIRAVWFNQPYLTQTLKKDLWVSFSGKVSLDNKGIYFSNPLFEVIGREPESKTMIHTGGLVPIYPETRGLTSRWLRYKIHSLLVQLPTFEEFLPDFLIKKYKLTGFDKAIRGIHFPKNKKEAAEARRRLAFNDLFLVQLFTAEERKKIKSSPAPTVPTNLALIKKFVGQLPFRLTDSQRLAAWQILKDLEKPEPMNRLLEGEVGSGKTVVAAIAALNAADTGWQTAILAPTEILAQQHYKTLQETFERFHREIAILTSSQAEQLGHSGVSRKDLIEKIGSGEVSIVIGTHAIIQKDIRFPRLGLVVVDEQHRFGVEQRAHLLRRTNAEKSQNGRRKENGGDFLYKDLTYEIRGAIFEVKKALGAGHKEKVYREALFEEFKKRKLPFEAEKSIEITYEGKKVGTYKPDFVVDDKVVVELKALPFLGAREKSQTWNYLKGTKYRVALLVNFGHKETEIERIVYDTSRNSASGLQSSASDQHYIPHLLSMTATPIPRTLALAFYGDLDLSIIKELPAGRKKILTRVVPPAKRADAYGFIEKQIAGGRQVFVICPLIEESKVLEVRSVTQEYEKLALKVFPRRAVAMLHGKMKAKEKEEIMKRFKAGEIDILVSTAVVEVGIDVPNASVMMIEGADRFGLAQLHQFRGRVGRASHQSYCFLFTDSPAKATQARLRALAELNDGFALAEKDLKIRGPGEFFGTAQSGLPDLAMASLTDSLLIAEVQEALKYFLSRSSLEEHPKLAARLAEFRKEVHWE